MPRDFGLLLSILLLFKIMVAGSVIAVTAVQHAELPHICFNIVISSLG